jgi:membrane protein
MERLPTPAPPPAVPDRLPEPLKRFVGWSMGHWLGRFVLGCMASSRRVELFDRSMAIAAQVFTSVLPLLIALASWFGWSDSEVAALLDLPPEARGLFEESLSTASAATFGTVGVLLVIASATSLSRALTRACAAEWDLQRPTITLAAAWRWVAAVLALVVALLAAKPLYHLSVRLPPQDFWDTFVGILPDVALALFLPWLLLAGAVRPRLLLPGALLFAVVMALIRPVSTRYLPEALQTSADHYGALGVAFSYLAWLYVVAFCFLLTGIMGKVITTDPGRLGSWIRAGEQPARTSSPPGTSRR